MQTAAASSHRQERVRYWNSYTRKRLARFYHEALERIYRFQVPAGLRVLEIGCGWGDLLASLRPSFGVGVDFSAVSIQAATRRHPGLRFVLADAHALPLTLQLTAVFVVPVTVAVNCTVCVKNTTDMFPSLTVTDGVLPRPFAQPVQSATLAKAAANK